MNKTKSAYWGDVGVQEACDTWNLDREDDDNGDKNWYDAVGCESSLEGIEDGDKVEVKVCKRKYNARYGRIQITKENHDKILEDDGMYAIGVYEDGNILKIELVEPEVIDDIIDKWWESNTLVYRQISWKEVFYAI